MSALACYLSDSIYFIFVFCSLSHVISVLLRWSVDTQVICIPKSVNPVRIKENFDIFDFKLTQKGIYLIILSVPFLNFFHLLKPFRLGKPCDIRIRGIKNVHPRMDWCPYLLLESLKRESLKRGFNYKIALILMKEIK
ncbi:hypothetical protein M1146_04490 [Patescibacteria group bacterium]|nr:hypothetical protein [Patescibacteria group bacterium]